MRTVNAQEDVAYGHMPVGEHQLALATHKRVDGGEAVARLDCVWGQPVEHGLAQGEAVIFRAEVAHVLVVTAAEGDEELLAIAEAPAVTLGAEVGLP